MIQSYDQIKKQANLINKEVEESVYIQKIYSSSYFLCLSLRLVGKTQFLYIGRGSSYEGLWLSDLRVESFLRKRDKLLEYIRKHLGACTFLSITMDFDDRIFSLNYKKWGRENKFFFFYRARNLYFANFYYDRKLNLMKCFKSWESKDSIEEVVDFNIFDEVGRSDLERKLGSGISPKDITELLAHEKKIAMKGSSAGKSKKFYNRKRGRILDDLERLNSTEELVSFAQEEQDFSNFGRVITIGAIKLKFKTSEHYKRRDEIYLKVKKLKKAAKILKLRLEDTDEHLLNYKEEVLINNLKTIAPVWKTVNKKSVIKKTLATKAFKLFEFSSFIMGVGLSAQGNDQLRNEWGRKTDIWFHLDSDKSAHAIIKLKGANLTIDVMEVVGSALIEFTQLSYGDANLVYTNVKNLKGVKGVSGTVIFKKEKRIRIVVSKDWRDSTL